MSSYTPGLAIQEHTTLIRRRRLPLKGHVLVACGDQVVANTTVAETELPGPVKLIPLANLLGLEPSELSDALVKSVGDTVDKGDTIAKTQMLFGLLTRSYEAPFRATIENISSITGQLVLRKPSTPVRLAAFVPGKVIEVAEEEGVDIETHGSYIQGILGIGGEAYGPIAVPGPTPEFQMTVEGLSRQYKGAVVVVGPQASKELLDKAVEVGVAGIISGGVDDQDLKDFLGYDLGVAITGSEKKGLTFIITEGFGQLPIAEQTFNILKTYEGHKASICGATQIRAGVQRPEIIIPRTNLREKDGLATLSLEKGAKVRLIREPYFGELAVITELPVQPQLIPTGAKVRVAEVKLVNTNKKIVLPRANLELVG